MKKVCVIRQPAGLGDILHLFKVAVKLLEQKKVNEVFWPVFTGYNYISEYIKYPGISFIDSKEDYPFKDFLEASEPRHIIDNDELIYIPFQIADQLVRSNKPGPLYCKYEFVGLDYKDWYKYPLIVRNIDRENYLEEFLQKECPFNVNNFNLVNRFYGTTHQERCEAAIPHIENEITIKEYDFDRPFDWLGLALKAKHIHTVDTSFCWLFRLFDITNLTLYGRGVKTNFEYCRGYCDDRWEFCGDYFGHVD
tara:strand:+ start:3467 stop:4219 length:753 start_codon:yes stop_codon:yes gene_type:complete